MSIKSVSKRTGKALLTATSAVVTVAHNGPREERIKEIDEAIAELQEERARLVDELI